MVLNGTIEQIWCKSTSFFFLFPSNETNVKSIFFCFGDTQKEKSRVTNPGHTMYDIQLHPSEFLKLPMISVESAASTPQQQLRTIVEHVGKALLLKKSAEADHLLSKAVNTSYSIHSRIYDSTHLYIISC